MRLAKIFKNGLIDENPAFVQVIGMCPTLAVTTSVFQYSYFFNQKGNTR